MSLLMARELVQPHAVRDVLETLKRDGAIRDYWIGEDMVKVSPARERRFDVAMVAMDLCFRRNPPKGGR